MKKANKTTKSRSPKSGGSMRKISSSTVSAPVSKSKVIRSTSRGTTRIVNSECIGTLMGHTPWNCDTWVINPGRTTFPWLMSIAPSFDVYKFHKLSFEYVACTSTATAGNICLAFDYHIDDDEPTTEQALTMTWCRVQGPLWTSSTLNVDVSKFNFKQYFTAVSCGPYKDTVDVGQLYVGVYGSNNSTIGQLYVHYDIELMEPQQPGLAPVDLDFGSPTAVVSSIAGPSVNPANWVVDPGTASRYALVTKDWLAAIESPYSESKTPALAGRIDMAEAIRFAEVSFGAKYRAATPQATPTQATLATTFPMEYDGVTSCLPTIETCSPCNSTASGTGYDEGRFSRTFLLSAAAGRFLEIYPYVQKTFADVLLYLTPFITIVPLSQQQYARKLKEGGY